MFVVLSLHIGVMASTIRVLLKSIILFFRYSRKKLEDLGLSTAADSEAWYWQSKYLGEIGLMNQRISQNSLDVLMYCAFVFCEPVLLFSSAYLEPTCLTNWLCFITYKTHRFIL